MNTLYIILGVLVCYTQAFTHEVRNSTGQHRFNANAKEYLIEENLKVNFWTAVQYCNQHKMQLVTIESPEENEAVLNKIKEFRLGSSEFWSSGSRIANDVEWIWLTLGQPITYFNWGDGEPNNKDKKERCLSLYYQHYLNGWWNDENCDAKLNIICETKTCP